MFTRVRAFGDSRSADFPADSAGAETLLELTDLISQLTTLRDLETAGAGVRRTHSLNRTSARQAIVDDLRAISRTARALKAAHPGIEGKFKFQSGKSDQAMLSTARAFINEARPLKEAFIRHDLPADFIEDLEADIAAFERIHDGQATTTIGGVQVTRAIDETIRRGLTTVKRLDAIVRNKYRANPAIIAAWDTASHIERAVAAKAPLETAVGTQS
jgi:hypothetical protein